MSYTEEQKAYHRAYYQKRRQALLDYLGGTCVLCGATTDLHFDHVVPSKKSFNINRNLTLNDTTKSELDKCQLLCATHHQAKTAIENTGFTHGTIFGWMKKNCPCTTCQSAKWSWHDERNKLRRVGSGYDVVSRRSGGVGIHS